MFVFVHAFFIEIENRCGQKHNRDPRGQHFFQFGHDIDEFCFWMAIDKTTNKPVQPLRIIGNHGTRRNGGVKIQHRARPVFVFSHLVAALAPESLDGQPCARAAVVAVVVVVVAAAVSVCAYCGAYSLPY